MCQLVVKEDEITHEYIDQLVKYRLGYSLALLEKGRTPQG
jgi:hypothetical protein